ncbi:MAG: sigma factor-like helix-turn-helix DNA-binding protein [Bacteroidota bacterium]
MKIQQIAGILDISPRSVENHLSKALKFLKEELKKIILASWAAVILTIDFTTSNFNK